MFLWLIFIILLKKKLKPNLDLLKEYIGNILDEYTITSIHEDLLRKALNPKFIDFKDGVQYLCAKEVGAELIITNDKKGFKNSDIETINSSDFYDKYIK